MSFKVVSMAKRVMEHSLSQVKDGDHDALLQIYELYQTTVVRGIIGTWHRRQLHASLRRWIDADILLKQALIETRVKDLLTDSTSYDDVKPAVKSQSLRTNEQVKDIVDWLKLSFTESLMLEDLAALDNNSLSNMGRMVGPIHHYESGHRIFHDSDSPNTLGLWLVMSGSVTLSVDSQEPLLDPVLESGDKFTSKCLCSLQEDFACAANDKDFQCHKGYTARASGESGAQVLHISRDAYLSSLGKLIKQKSDMVLRSQTIHRCLEMLMGKKYVVQAELVEKLAEKAVVEKLPRKANVRKRSDYFGILEQGACTVFTSNKSGKTAGSCSAQNKKQVAVISEVGAVASCSAEEANTNKKRSRKGFTQFEHALVVSSSEAVLVWIPLSTLDGAGNSVRSELATISERQAKQRSDRNKSANGILKGVGDAETGRRRNKAAQVLKDANLQAQVLKAHVAEFMDWKKDLDEDMSFSDLDLSPARPSLSVVSPTKSQRWSWSHNQRNFEGNANSNKSRNRTPSKYSVMSNRKTLN